MFLRHLWKKGSSLHEQLGVSGTHFITPKDSPFCLTSLNLSGTMQLSTPRAPQSASHFTSSRVLQGRNLRSHLGFGPGLRGATLFAGPLRCQAQMGRAYRTGLFMPSFELPFRLVRRSAWLSPPSPTEWVPPSSPDSSIPVLGATPSPQGYILRS